MWRDNQRRWRNGPSSFLFLFAFKSRVDSNLKQKNQDNQFEKGIKFEKEGEERVRTTRRRKQNRKKTKNNNNKKKRTMTRHEVVARLWRRMQRLAGKKRRASRTRKGRPGPTGQAVDPLTRTHTHTQTHTHTDTHAYTPAGQVVAGTDWLTHAGRRGRCTVNTVIEHRRHSTAHYRSPTILEAPSVTIR